MERLGLTRAFTLGLAGAASVYVVFTLCRSGSKNKSIKKEPAPPSKEIEIVYDPDSAEYGGIEPKPGQQRRAAVDIIAVHGLASSSDKAWTDRKTGMNWLHDFLPSDLAHRARIITYNHNSQYGAYSLTKPFEGYAKEFLLALARVRSDDDERRRPIIFVGHSFGGLLIKQALVMASEPAHHSRYGNIVQYTDGVVFLGVPHRGSRYTTLANMVVFATYLLNSSNVLLKYMEYKSTVGAALQKRYRDICEGRSDQVCFYECKPMMQFGRIPTGLVVGRESATMDGWGEEVPLEADHKGMNKFPSREDGNYIDVLQQLKLMVGKVINGVYATARLSDSEKNCLQSFLETDYLNHRARLAEQRHPGTLEWFMNSEEYKQWASPESGSSTLWVSGNPGCGKTVLSATVTGHLLQTTVSEGANVVSIFCDDKDERRRTASSVLNSVIYQLLAMPSNHHLIAKHALSAYNAEGAQLFSSFESLWKLLVAIATDISLKGSYCIIDGLDECEPVSRHDLLSRIGRLSQTLKTNPRRVYLKFLLTSRPLMDIEERLESYPISRLRLEEHETQINSDIALLAVASAAHLARKRGYTPALQAKVAAALEAGADGSFLWVSLVVEQLRVTLASRVEAKLNALPRGMDELYLDLLAQIDGDAVEFARTVLTRVATAVRPLTLRELALACTIEAEPCSEANGEESAALSAERAKVMLASLEQDLEIIGPILKIHEIVSVPSDDRRIGVGYTRSLDMSDVMYAVEGKTVHLVHQSAKEFMNSIVLNAHHQLRGFAVDPVEANAEMAKICLKHLSFSEMEEGPFDARMYIECEEAMNERRAKYPFLVYCAYYWPYHAQKSGRNEPTLWEPFRRVAASRPKLNLAWQIWSFYNRDENTYKFLTLATYEQAPPLVIVSCFGLEHLARQLLDTGVDVNATGGHLGSALTAAIYAHHEPIIHLLIAHGADVNQTTMFMSAANTPLTVAAAKNAGVFQLLLSMSANVNMLPGALFGPLHLAAESGHVAQAQALLDNGADLNARSEGDETPLYTAARWGHVAMIRLLVERGADVNAVGGQWHTALQVAAYGKHVDAVRVLLELDADVNPVPGGDAGTPLQAGVRDTAVTRLLLAAEADVNLGGGFYGTPLQAATRAANVEVIQLLIARGADVNARGGRLGSAIQAAAEGGHPHIVQLLLDAGADPNVRGGRHGTCLLAALYNHGHDHLPAVLRMLLDRGAEVGRGVDWDNRALQLAAAGGSNEAMAMLLEHGADFRVQSEQYGDALRAAVKNGMLTTAFQLLSKGADPNSADQFGRPPLLHVALEADSNHLARSPEEADEWYVVMVRMLLMYGADVNAVNEQQETALDLALKYAPKRQAAEEAAKWLALAVEAANRSKSDIGMFAKLRSYRPRIPGWS